MKLKRAITIGLTGCVLLTSVQVSAKTLKDSFSGGSNYKYVSYNSKNDVYKYKKTTYAKTEGYDKWHYVRAYIGGTKDNPNGAEVDSKRKWKSGDVEATVSITKSIPGSDVLIYKTYFPTGYAKYGD